MSIITPDFTPYTLRLEFQGWRASKMKPIAVCYKEKNKSPIRRLTGVYVLPEHWDEDTAQIKGHPSAASLNKIINARLDKFLKKAASLEVAEMPVTAAIMGGTSVPVADVVDFAKFAKSVRGDNGITTTQLNRIEKFHGSMPKLADIDLEWLRLYQAYMKEDMDLHPNTVVGAFEFLRRVLNVAAGEKKILEQPMDHPSFIFPKKEETDPVFLVDDELEKVINWVMTQPEDRNDPVYSNMVYFAIACHVGYRFGDWHKIGEHNPPYKVNGEWLFRVRAQKNGKPVVVPVGDTVLNLYKRAVHVKPADNVSKAGAIIKEQCKALGIEKEVATHVARHTCGYKCASEEMARETLAEVLGVGARIVKVYYHLTGENITKQAGAMRKW